MIPVVVRNVVTEAQGVVRLVLGSEEYKDQAKFKIHSFASHAQNPTWFTTAPVEAVKKNLAMVGYGRYFLVRFKRMF